MPRLRTRIHGYWFRCQHETWRPTHLARYLSDQHAGSHRHLRSTPDGTDAYPA